MIKRRSFLAMLGIVPAVPALAAAKAVETAPIATQAVTQTAIETTVMAKIAMPVKIGLTQEQVDLCEIMKMDIREYAKHLLELKQEGLIQSDFEMVADSKDLYEPVMSADGKMRDGEKYVNKTHA